MTGRIQVGAAATALALALTCLAPAAGRAATVTDASGRTVDVADASRIVSIGGAVTEILYALGLEDRVVAVDVTSTFPSRARSKPSVGYMRKLSAEGVLSLGPSVVIAIEGSGPKDAIDVLERASVPFVLVPEAHDPEGVAAAIRLVADVAGESAKGAALADAVLADIASFEKMRRVITERRKAVFVLGINGGAPLAAGEKTSAADMFALAGVDNALSATEGYKPANDEAMLAAAPEAIVLMAERSHGVTEETVFSLPAFAGTPAARDKRLLVMSGTYLLNFGPRTAHAVRDLAAAIYPEVGLPKLPERPWTRDQVEGAANE